MPQKGGSLKIKLIVIAVITMVAILGVAGLVLANSSNDSQGTSTLTPSPVNVDWNFLAGLVEVNAASFQPVISESQAISTVRDVVREWFYPKPEDLPTTATLATFTGECQDALHTKVQDLPVWVVVIKGIPDIGHGTGSEQEQEKISKPGTCQVNAAIDAYTGVLIYGVTSGKD